MKKFLVVCAAAMLCCSLVRAQEAEDAGSGAVLSIIPRLDVGALYNVDNESFGVSFGNTSLYTLFEGNISEKWGFSLCNHWIQADGWVPNFLDAFGPSTMGLYHLNIPFLKNQVNNANNFVDWAYVTFSPGPFTFTLGKQVQLMGGFEYDDYDFDVNPLMASSLWNSYTCYQWGLTAAWTMLRETSTLSLQVTSDAWGRGVAVGLGWDGTYGPFSMKWSVLGYQNYLPTVSPAKLDFLVSLGNRVVWGPATITLDYMNACGDPLALASGHSVLYPAIKGHTAVASVVLDFPKWDIGLKGIVNEWNPASPYGVDANGDPFCPSYVADDTVVTLIPDDFADLPYLTAGLWGSWYPLRDSRDLRIQLAAGLSEINPMQRYISPFATIGVTWNWNINLW